MVSQLNSGHLTGCWRCSLSILAKLSSMGKELRSGLGYAKAGFDSAKPPTQPGSGTFGTWLLGISVGSSDAELEEKIFRILFSNDLKN